MPNVNKIAVLSNHKLALNKPTLATDARLVAPALNKTTLASAARLVALLSMCCYCHTQCYIQAVQ